MPFIPDSAILVQFAIAIVILAITPGPDMTLFVGRALSQGRAAGMACMMGAMAGIFIHSTLIAIGLSALIVASPNAFFALKIGGAGYLIWLAIQAIRSGSAFSLNTGAKVKKSLLANWMTGIGINLLNPKIILFFVTFLPQFVSAADPNAPGKLMFLGIMVIVVSVPITIPMILAADRFSLMLRSKPLVTRIVDWLFAGVFSAFAVKILMTQTR